MVAPLPPVPQSLSLPDYVAALVERQLELAPEPLPAGPVRSIMELAPLGVLTPDWGPIFTQALQSGQRWHVPAVLNSAGLPVPYVMATPVNCLPARGSALVGDGRNTILAPSFSGADYFYLGSPLADTWGVRLEGLSFAPTVQQQPGLYAVHFKRANECCGVGNLLGGLETYAGGIGTSKIAGGYFFEQFGLCGVIGGDICGVAGDAITLMGDPGDEQYGAEFLVDGQLSIYGCGTAVHLAGSAGGVYLKRLNVTGCALGVRASNSAEPNRELFTFADCTIDSCPGMGVHIEAGALSYWLLSGTWVGACGTAGVPAVLIDAYSGVGAQTYVHGVFPRIHSNAYDGWAQFSGAFNCSGVSAFSNGAGLDPVEPGVAAGGHGFYFGGNVAELVIDGVSEGNGNATRGCGLYVDVGVGVVDARVSGVSNGQGAAMSNAGGNGNVGGTRRFHNTAGFTSRSNGYATVPQGQSSLVVNHGLNGSPTSVTQAPAGAQDAGAYAYVAPGSFTATTFTLSLSAPAGAARSFSFEACRE